MPIKILCLFIAVLFVFMSGCGINDDEISTKNESVEYTVLPEPTSGLPSGDENEDKKSVYAEPVDFAKYKEYNPEVYAFIHIPGTNIDYPIVQSTKDDNYYLKHDYKKSYTYKGSIFTQSVNAVDFSDPITLIYGHNTDKGDMFSELLYFRDKKFFEENDLIYIYLPGHILVYRIISAHAYDKRHIMNSYDFSDRNTLLDFQQTLLSPASLESNVRHGIALDEDSKIIVLSTCIEAKSTAAARFLVNGVLIKDVIAR